MVVKSKVAISDIVGGTAPPDRDMGDNITAQTLYDTYRWYTGLKTIVKLEVDVLWSNGLNEETIEPDRIIECKDANEYMNLYGYSVVIVDATQSPPTADAWHPMINGVGFRFSETSPFGDALEIEIMMDTTETQGNHGKKPIKVDAYPCETYKSGIKKGERILTQPIPGNFGFFCIRTRGGIKGLRGLPKYLDLIDPIIGQNKILKSYIPYAEKQGLAHPVVYLKDASPTNRAQVKSDFKKQPQKDRLVIISTNDLLEYESPQQSAYNPEYILEWVDNLIARDTQMNKVMLEGDALGQVASSETVVANWEAKIKESQVYLRTQFLPIFLALGGGKDITFSDPSKPSFLRQMEGIKAIKEGMEGLVAKESIVKLMNERLELEGDEKLVVAEDEEMEDEGDGFGESDNGD